MTIYAVVNSILGDQHVHISEEPLWTLISPAAILQGGNPYFVPDFASRFQAHAALAARIGKLGKGIAPRFASRYIDAVAPAVLFVAVDRLNRLKAENLPWTSALSYDRSLAVGKFTPMGFDAIPACECSMLLESAGPADQKVITSAACGLGLDKILESISRDNTLKTGDLLLVWLSESGPEVRPGMRLRLRLNGEDSLRFNIR